MLNAPIPENESARIQDLKGLKVLDTASEERFNRIVRIAQILFNTPIVAISLIDTNRQWFKAYCGLDVSETSRDISFCGHAILGNSIFIINDTLLDTRFADNPLVKGAPFIRFYAGMPLHGPSGQKIGTLCVIDSKPREFNVEQKQSLMDLAQWVELELNSLSLRLALDNAKSYTQKLEAINKMMVDRELKMVELKKEVEGLKSRYSI